MTPVPVNYLAIILSAVAAIVIGFIWYGPLFGQMWIKMMGWTKADIKKGQSKGMMMQYGVSAIGSLVMAYILANFLAFATAYTGIRGLNAGIITGFGAWLGFIAPFSLNSVLWEGKSWNLWLLNNGYSLVTLLTMGTILALWV